MALYALPDHDVVSALVPHVLDRHVETGEAVRLLKELPGLVPLAIDHRDGGRILWGDLGQHAFREWQYIFTVSHLARAGKIETAFTTTLDILDDDSQFSDSLVPSGFIFHISRCGSTLSAKALARPDGHMMISQGGPLQRGFWAAITDDFTKPLTMSPRNIRRLRTLVLAMTRRRLGSERKAFVKFISWNILYADMISAAFPDVPGLFLYRDPVEVIASVRKETTAALVAKGTAQGAFLADLPLAETVAMTDTDYLAACYAHYFKAALKTDSPLSFVNYRDLSRDSFLHIAEYGLNCSFEDHELLAMSEQFRYHSKDDSNSSRFLDDKAQKQMVLTEAERGMVDRHCAGLMAQLDTTSRNLFTPVGVDRAGNSSETIARSYP